GARIAGARMIIAVDTVESKFEKARELGATHTVNAKADDPVKMIRTMTNGGVDYSFEAIGLKIAAEQCFDCIRPGGTATVIGMIPVGQKIELDGPMFLREKKIQGCSMGSNRFKVDMPRYIEFYRQGRLKLDEMVSRRGKLEDVNEAFRAMKAGEVARTVLRCGWPTAAPARASRAGVPRSRRGGSPVRRCSLGRDLRDPPSPRGGRVSSVRRRTFTPRENQAFVDPPNGSLLSGVSRDTCSHPVRS